jgi:hypothetical protein
MSRTLERDRRLGASAPLVFHADERGGVRDRATGADGR